MLQLTHTQSTLTNINPTCFFVNVSVQTADKDFMSLQTSILIFVPSGHGTFHFDLLLVQPVVLQFLLRQAVLGGVIAGVCHKSELSEEICDLGIMC